MEEDGWDKFYRTALEEAGRLSFEMLDRFRVSLGDWLYANLNWPTPDWREQLALFVEHTRYYGLVIEPECVQTIHDLIEARVDGTGPFAILGPYGAAKQGAAADVPIKLAVNVAVDDSTRTDATAVEGPKTPPRQIRPTQRDIQERFFNEKLAQAQGYLVEMEKALEALGQKLDAAKADELVEVETEVDAIESLIWQYNDALESARDAWLRDDLGGDTFDRLVLIITPMAFNLPLFTDQQQAERAKQQEILIAKRLDQRIATLDRIIFAMQAMETAGTAASFALGAGVVISAVRTGGKWAVVKTIAKVAGSAGAAYVAGEAAESGLRAVGADEETIHGVRLAAEVVTWLLLLRRVRAAGAKPAPPAAPRPEAPNTTVPSTTRPIEPRAPRGPLKNPSGNLEDAARAPRTQPNGPTRVPAGARSKAPEATKVFPRIEGTLDKPRTWQHQFVQRTVAEEMQATGAYKRIGTRMRLSEFSGRKHTPDIMPDNIGLTTEGRIDMIEIRSPGQTVPRLEKKLMDAMNQLPPEMRGEFRVIDPEDAFK